MWGKLWLVPCVVLVGCGADRVAVPPSSSGLAPSAQRVSAASWTDGVWPLSVESGTLACRDQAVTFTAESGATYGVNGVAQRQYPDVLEVAVAPVGPLLDLGLSLC